MPLINDLVLLAEIIFGEVAKYIILQDIYFALSFLHFIASIANDGGRLEEEIIVQRVTRVFVQIMNSADFRELVTAIVEGPVQINASVEGIFVRVRVTSDSGLTTSRTIALIRFLAELFKTPAGRNSRRRDDDDDDDDDVPPTCGHGRRYLGHDDDHHGPGGGTGGYLSQATWFGNRYGGGRFVKARVPCSALCTMASIVDQSNNLDGPSGISGSGRSIILQSSALDHYGSVDAQSSIISKSSTLDLVGSDFGESSDAAGGKPANSSSSSVPSAFSLSDDVPSALGSIPAELC